MEPGLALLALAELLSAPKEDEDDEEEEGPERVPPRWRRAGPGDIGAPEAPPSKAPGPGPAEVRPGDKRGIWASEEVPEGSGCDGDAWDPREQPEYEILFKQQVGPEDMFLGMSRKDPSSACCEDLLVKIKLPDTKASDITLDIREKVLDLRSPKKKLLLHLPHPVDTKSGKACFLQEKGILEVTLRMKREFDFINFA